MVLSDKDEFWGPNCLIRARLVGHNQQIVGGPHTTLGNLKAISNSMVSTFQTWTKSRILPLFIPFRSYIIAIKNLSSSPLPLPPNYRFSWVQTAFPRPSHSLSSHSASTVSFWKTVVAQRFGQKQSNKFSFRVPLYWRMLFFLNG